jgi:hypothetical protein
MSAERIRRQPASLQQLSAGRVKLASGSCPQLVGEQHLEMRLQHLVVSIRRAPVGATGEELLLLELGQDRGACGDAQQLITHVSAQQA